MGNFVILIIRFYQGALSPFLGKHCRFLPSCSQYAAEAIEMRGVCLGLIIALLRLCRCNVFFQGGYDPVPESGLYQRKVAIL